MTRIKLHLGYSIAALGYMAAIYLLSSAPIRNPLPELPSTLLHIPLFASLALCLLLSVIDGQWDRTVSRRTYWLVGLLTTVYAILSESYQYLEGGHYASVGDILVDCVGIAALLVFHRTTQWCEREVVEDTYRQRRGLTVRRAGESVVEGSKKAHVDHKRLASSRSHSIGIMFVTAYFEPDSGAAAVRLSRLAKMLAARGHQITVLTAMPHYPHGCIGSGYRGKFALVENRDGVRIIRTWLWATPSPRISRKLISQTTLMLTTMLRGLVVPSPDVAVIEAQPFFSSLAGILLSHVKRVPYVLNVSDLWPDHLLSVGALSESSIPYRLARGVVDATYRRAAGIVPMTPALAGAIRQYIGSDSKIKIIHNGVDLIRFRPGQDVTAFRRTHQLGDHKIVSFIGTFATAYDFRAMLAIVDRFSHRPDVCFVFVGCGSQDGILRERLARGDLARCRWIKWIDHTEVPLAWAASHVAYWALRDHDLYRGTIPAKLYEALASGVPVAAATEGESEAIISRSEAGLTVSSGDVDGLVDAVRRLLDDVGLHKRCSQSGRAYAEVHFDPENVTSAYEELLMSVRWTHGGVPPGTDLVAGGPQGAVSPETIQGHSVHTPGEWART